MTKTAKILFAMYFGAGVCAVPGATSLAADSGPWTLTTASFATRVVGIAEIDAQGLHLSPEGGTSTQPSVVPWDDVLELSHPCAPQVPDADDVLLTNGDELRGTPLSTSGEQVQWQNSMLGTVSLSLDHILAITHGGAAPTNLDKPRTDDVVELANGDELHGIVSQVSSAGVAIQTSGATPTLAWDSVKDVLLATTPAASQRMFRVRLADGSAVSGTSIRLAGDRLTLDIPENPPRALNLAQVASIEQLNGPISWLTSHRPTAAIYRPFFDESFPARFDRTVADDEPIREKYPGFHHGIGCHSYSLLTFALDGKYAAFRTDYAIDGDSPLADVTIRILLDGKPVLQRASVKAGQAPGELVTPLGHAKTLGLEVDYGANYAIGDRFVWLDPALLKEMPATQPANP